MKTNNFSLILEIPLALLSLIFSKLNKLIIGNLYTLYLKFNKKISNQWRVIDNKLVSSNLNLGVLMTKAPRWNTHAIIGTLGPFYVENSLNIDLKSPSNSAQSWIAIFYDFPNYKTITTIESKDINSEKEWQLLELKSGKYTIGLRYYDYGNKLILPAIKVDNKELTSSLEIPNNSNDFYTQLINRKNIYHLWLHYYIYTILKLKKYLPESFVKNEFLPVGATDTKFYYDYLDTNDILEIKVDEFTLNNYDIYVTLYERCSLPISWFKLTNTIEKTKPLSNQGYYLIRIRQKNICTDDFASVNIKLQSTRVKIDN